MPQQYTYRDPTLSLWQSAVHQRELQRQAAPTFAVTRTGDGASPPPTEQDLMGPAHDLGVSLSENQPLPAAIAPPPRAAQPGAAVAPPEAEGPIGVAVNCAETVAKFLWAEIKGDHDRSKDYAHQLQYGPCNLLGWGECVTTYLAYKASLDSLPYIKNQDGVITIPDTATIAIIGDWGTGDAVAQNLLQQVATFKPTILLHLGDIYFSGTADETTNNFLTICRNILPDAQIYSLCGNHDMYSGGDGYYGLLAQIGQNASYFCLQNNYWRMLAMDTGYHDCNPFTVASNMTSLYADDDWDEAKWHRNNIQQAGNRKIAVFSHHQLFSPFGPVGSVDRTPSAINPNLLANFQDLLHKIDIWFWGHEHTLALYDQYLGLERGRCVGASAVPVFKDQQVYEPDTTLLNDQVKTLPTWNPAGNLAITDGAYNNAFAIMTLNGADAAVVDYYQVAPEKKAMKIPFTDTI